MGNAEEGQRAFLIGILSTIVLFTAAFIFPEELLAKVPKFIISTVYTVIIYAIVEKMHGEELRLHKEEKAILLSLT